IRVNCICPGAIDTDMLQEMGRLLGHGDVAAGYALMTQNRPMKRVAAPSEIANPILYLASDLASFVTGSIHVVDGGVTAKAGCRSVARIARRQRLARPGQGRGRAR